MRVQPTDGESWIRRSGTRIFRISIGQESARSRLGFGHLSQLIAFNDKLAVAGREPSSHLRGRSSRPAGGRRGNDAERAACRIRCWLADFLPNKVITTRITFLACAYRPVGGYATANGQIHCPGAAGLLRSHRQLALRPDSSVDLVA